MDVIKTKADALISLTPFAKWVVRGDEIVRWDDKTETQPSDAEIDAEIVRLQAEYDAQEYARKREAEYPSIIDVTVALAEKAEGDTTMWNTITAERAAVKAKFTKTE